MTDLILRPPSAPTRPMTLWERVTSLFLPQVPAPSPRSMFEGYPEQARHERPLPVRTQTRWFHGDIDHAVHLADQGDLSRAAQLSRALRRDGLLGGLLSTRTGGLTRLPKAFRGTESVVQTMQDDSQERLFNRIFSPKELALLVGDGVLLGVGVGELLYLPDRPEPVFVRLDPEFLRYRWSHDTWYYQSIAGELKITPGDGRWILHMPGGFQQPWANGLWSSLARAYVAKDHAFQQRENYSSKLANPARVAVSPTGSSEAQEQAWFRKVMAWGINTVFGLRPGYDVRLLESNGQGYQVFQETITSSDKEIMVGLVGQVVTVDGGAGFANANIHATIRTDIIQDDADGLANTLNDQGLRQVVNYLFGAGNRCAVEWDTKPPADLKADADAISAAAKCIEDANRALRGAGLQIVAREIATRFKVPVEPLGGEPPPDAGRLSSGDAPPTDESAALLAQKMTDARVERCEHGSSNRCRLCGVERVRDFVVEQDGSHTWQIAWRSIAQSPLRLVAKEGT